MIGSNLGCVSKMSLAIFTSRQNGQPNFIHPSTCYENGLQRMSRENIKSPSILITSDKSRVSNFRPLINYFLWITDIGCSTQSGEKEIQANTFLATNETETLVVTWSTMIAGSLGQNPSTVQAKSLNRHLSPGEGSYP